MSGVWKSRDYFAEMYVAGLLADAGWNVYFPRRDQGFDMIATLATPDGIVIRPVQVKGKYPTEGKTSKVRYGFVGELTALHHDMVLAIPLFAGMSDAAPMHVAWMPATEVRPTPNGGHRCEPAKFTAGGPAPRQGFVHFFDRSGLTRLAVASWPDTTADLVAAMADPGDQSM